MLSPLRPTSYVRFFSRPFLSPPFFGEREEDSIRVLLLPAILDTRDKMDAIRLGRHEFNL